MSGFFIRNHTGQKKKWNDIVKVLKGGGGKTANQEYYTWQKPSLKTDERENFFLEK